MGNAFIDVTDFFSKSEILTDMAFTVFFYFSNDFKLVFMSFISWRTSVAHSGCTPIPNGGPCGGLIPYPDTLRSPYGLGEYAMLKL